MLAFNKS